MGEEQSPSTLPSSLVVTLLRSVLISIGVIAAWCLLSLATFILMYHLDTLRKAIFIPYPAESYQSLSVLADWLLPHSFLGWASVPFYNAPISMAAFTWLTCVSFQVSTLFLIDFPGLPKRSRRGQSRHFILQQLVLTKLKLFAFYSLLLAIPCLPAMRCYEIIEGDYLRTKNYFSWDERQWPLNELREISRDGKGRGPVTWSFDFNDGRTYTMIGVPSISALARMLDRPNVKSNVAIRDGRLVANVLR